MKELKPNPEVYLKIINELRVKKEDCIIIEDSLIGVEAANNAGIDVAVIYDKYSDCDREKINELSQYRFSDFKEMLNELDLKNIPYSSTFRQKGQSFLTKN